MNQEIFSEDGRLFLSKKMGICLNDLSQKILSDAPSNTDFFKQLVDFILTLNPPYQYGELGHINNRKNHQYLDKELYNFFNKFNFGNDSLEHFIFDNIRHAFINYCKGGILEVYKYREAEVWYPKIIIQSNIEDKIDIDKLDQEITIYRGTSDIEYNSSKFSQPWTLDKDIARDFAFIHYATQPKYNQSYFKSKNK